MALKTPPGPRTCPGFGNLFNVQISSLQHSLWSHREHFGDISSFQIGGKTFIVLNSMQETREALEGESTASLLADRPDTFFQRFVTGDGIALAPYSDTWRMLRGVTHDFVKTVNNPWFDASVRKEITHITDLYRLSSNESTPVDLTKSLKYFVASIAVIFMTGERKEYDDDIYTLLAIYAKNATKLFRPTALSMLTKLPFLRHIPFPYGRSFKKMIEAKNKLMRCLIYDRKQSSSNCSDEKNGFVSHVLDAQKTNSELTDERIECVLQDLFTAGVPGLTSSLLALFHQLAHNPHVQDKIYDELVTVVEKDREVTLNDERRLPYTRAVILESTRLASVVPGSVARINHEDVTISGYKLPKGSIFITNLWRIHHDSEVYDQPWSFKPERFLDHDGSLFPADHPTRRHLAPFGVGVRRCVGQILSESTMFRYVTSVYRHFSFRATDKESDCDPRRYTRDILMYPPAFTVAVTSRLPIHEQTEITI